MRSQIPLLKQLLWLEANTISNQGQRPGLASFCPSGAFQYTLLLHKFHDAAVRTTHDEDAALTHHAKREFMALQVVYCNGLVFIALLLKLLDG